MVERFRIPKGREIALCLIACVLAAEPAAGQPEGVSSGAAPQALLDLLPQEAVNRDGTLNSAGPLAMASLSCDLAASYPCITQKYPLRVTASLQIFSDSQLFNMQAPMVLEQDIANQKSAMQHKYDGKPKIEYRFGGEAKDGGATRKVMTVEGPGGTILYCDWIVDCSEYEHMERPQVKLHAAARTKEALLLMDVDGVGTGDEALAIARGIMDRFTKADFAKIHP